MRCTGHHEVQLDLQPEHLTVAAFKQRLADSLSVTSDAHLWCCTRSKSPAQSFYDLHDVACRHMLTPARHGQHFSRDPTPNWL